MLSKIRKQTEGFTIIEVLIVLAIAALILLIVFLAVPALQRNSRNTQIRNDAAVVLGYVSDFVSNNNGGAPSWVCATATGEVRLGPVGAPAASPAPCAGGTVAGNIRAGITTSSVTAETGVTATQTLLVNMGRACNQAEDGTAATAANNRVSATASARAIAISFQTERNGGTDWQCTDS